MIRRTLIAAFLAAAALPAFAQLTIAGESFEGQASVGGSKLLLNGVGLRAVAWIKGYAAGLYMTQKAAEPAQAMAMAGAKRIRLRMMMEAPTEEFVKAIDKGIGRNMPESAQAGLAERRERFNAQVRAVGKVKKGDVVDLDFVPERGLVFSYNGKAQGEPIPGADFYAAVMSIFLGDKPVDKKLKAGLLGEPPA
ncbi:MAG: chalcone isomerase family protein [Rubrivivax sp.]